MKNKNNEAVTTIEFKRTRHGDPFDRGAADSYYRRSRNPHYYLGNTGFSPRIEETDMTELEVKAYHAGFDSNEAEGDFKDYGRYL
jgi:hypothetical protein